MFSPALRSCLLLAALLGGPAAYAQAPAEPNAPPARATPATPPAPKPLPADVTTHHTLELPGRTLHFSATAGAIRLTDDKGAPRADIAFIAYQLDGVDPRSRKVTFVMNGGPGFASGWLQVGAVGPWRIPLGGQWGTGDGPVGLARAAAECRDLAGFHRPGVHRSGRYRLFARAHQQRRGAQAAVLGQRRHRLSGRGDPALAGPVRPQRLAEIPAGRELRRLPRPTAGARAGLGAGRRRVGPGDGLAAARCRRAELRVRSVLLRRPAALDDRRGARGARAGGGGHDARAACRRGALRRNATSCRMRRRASATRRRSSGAARGWRRSPASIRRWCGATTG